MLNGIKIIEYNTFFKKFLGLMFKNKNINYGIRLKNCNCIHTFFMRFNIDVIITDKNNMVLYVKQNLKKNKITPFIKNGYYTYEAKSGSFNNIKVNSIIKMK